MRALLSDMPGGPETLELRDVPEPMPGPGDLLVRVRACAINYPDVLIIEDKYQMRPPRPFAPGGEVAGEVIALGDGVADWQTGERLVAVTGFGGLAEMVVVPAKNAFRLPAERSFTDGAALLLTYATSIHGLYDRGRLQAGQTLLVLGAAGGVGLAAVDLGVALGARVLAAASSPEKLKVCTQRGAEAVIDYDREDLKSRIREITGDGAQAVLDPVGGPYAEPALRSLARGGRFVTLGYAAGSIPAIPLNLVMLKGISVQGMEIRTFATDHPKENERDLAELAELFAGGRVSPYIGARFDLADTAAALRYVADRKAVGKVIIDV
jgi:NADPH:quinone reductase-like Zn-dependent oxidoreductase